MMLRMKVHAWTALMAVAVTACIPERVPAPRLEPLLRVSDKALAFIKANCAVPLRVTEQPYRSTVGPRRFLAHVCDDQRKGVPRTLSMGIVFEDDSGEIVNLWLRVDADDRAQVDPEFYRAYASLIDPLVTPVMRSEVRAFSRETYGDSLNAWSDLDQPPNDFWMRAAGEPFPHRTLLIRTSHPGVSIREPAAFQRDPLGT